MNDVNTSQQNDLHAYYLGMFFYNNRINCFNATDIQLHLDMKGVEMQNFYEAMKRGLPLPGWASESHDIFKLPEQPAWAASMRGRTMLHALRAGHVFLAIEALKCNKNNLALLSQYVAGLPCLETRSKGNTSPYLAIPGYQADKITKPDKVCQYLDSLLKGAATCNKTVSKPQQVKKAGGFRNDDNKYACYGALYMLPPDVIVDLCNALDWQYENISIAGNVAASKKIITPDRQHPELVRGKVGVYDLSVISALDDAAKNKLAVIGDVKRYGAPVETAVRCARTASWRSGPAVAIYLGMMVKPKAGAGILSSIKYSMSETKSTLLRSTTDQRTMDIMRGMIYVCKYEKGIEIYKNLDAVENWIKEHGYSLVKVTEYCNKENKLTPKKRSMPTEPAGHLGPYIADEHANTDAKRQLIGLASLMQAGPDYETTPKLDNLLGKDMSLEEYVTMKKGSGVMLWTKPPHSPVQQDDGPEVKIHRRQNSRNVSPLRRPSPGPTHRVPDPVEVTVSPLQRMTSPLKRPTSAMWNSPGQSPVLRGASPDFPSRVTSPTRKTTSPLRRSPAAQLLYDSDDDIITPKRRPSNNVPSAPRKK